MLRACRQLGWWPSTLVIILATAPVAAFEVRPDKNLTGGLVRNGGPSCRVRTALRLPLRAGEPQHQAMAVVIEEPRAPIAF